jgi:hypothetical protein
VPRAAAEDFAALEPLHALRSVLPRLAAAASPALAAAADLARAAAARRAGQAATARAAVAAAAAAAVGSGAGQHAAALESLKISASVSGRCVEGGAVLERSFTRMHVLWAEGERDTALRALQRLHSAAGTLPFAPGSRCRSDRRAPDETQRPRVSALLGKWLAASGSALSFQARRPLARCAHESDRPDRCKRIWRRRPLRRRRMRMRLAACTSGWPCVRVR